MTRAIGAVSTLEGSGGMLLQDFFFIKLIEYGISLCILKYKIKSKFVLVKTMCRWHAVVRCRGSGVGGGGVVRPPGSYISRLQVSSYIDAGLGVVS